MNSTLTSVLLLALPVLAAAADTEAARLQEMLARHPEADANRDGTLSLEEAKAFDRTLRQKKRARKGVATDGKNNPAESNHSRRLAPTQSDVRYGPHERNLLDLWLAPSEQPTPVVVFIHGGGFENGSKSGVNGDMIRACQEAGVSFMSINYRFKHSAPIQDILRDCARSIQFIRANAKRYNIDPRRIAAYGRSAGAGSSLWLAFHDDLADPQSSDPVLRESSRIIAAGAYNAQSSYNTRRWAEILGAPDPAWERGGGTAAFYGASSNAELDSERMQRVLHDVDMLAHISKDDPPVFMYTKAPDGPLQNRGHYVHHPNHIRAVKKACDAVRVPASAYFSTTEPKLTGDWETALRAFLLEHIAAASTR